MQVSCLAVADFAADSFNLRFGIAAHRPVALAAADIIQKVAQYLRAVLGVHNLGVELHAVHVFIGILHSRNGAIRRVSD